MTVIGRYNLWCVRTIQWYVHQFLTGLSCWVLCADRMRRSMTPTTAALVSCTAPSALSPTGRPQQTSRTASSTNT